MRGDILMLYDAVRADVRHYCHDAIACLDALIHSISVTALVDVIIRTFGSTHLGGAALAKLTFGLSVVVDATIQKGRKTSTPKCGPTVCCCHGRLGIWNWVWC